MAAQLRTVLRSIPGCSAAPGTVVDVSGWRQAQTLERARYLGPVEAAEAAPKARVPRQRTASE